MRDHLLKGEETVDLVDLVIWRFKVRKVRKMIHLVVTRRTVVKTQVRRMMVAFKGLTNEVLGLH